MKLTDDEILAAAARIQAARRKTHGGGRPRKKGRRCPCGEMTLTRASARGHKCEKTEYTTKEN